LMEVTGKKCHKQLLRHLLQKNKILEKGLRNTSKHRRQINPTKTCQTC